MTDDTPLYDYEAAKAWRERLRYTRPALAALTGYSVASIVDFETGFVRGDMARPVKPSSMRRYRLVVAAVTHGLADWEWTDA